MVPFWLMLMLLMMVMVNVMKTYQKKFVILQLSEVAEKGIKIPTIGAR